MVEWDDAVDDQSNEQSLDPHSARSGGGTDTFSRGGGGGGARGVNAA